MKRTVALLLPLTSMACKDPVVLESYLAIVHISPNDGSVNVSTEAYPSAIFTEALTEASVTPQHVFLEDDNGEPVEAEVDYEPSTRSLTLVPVALLQPASDYSFVLTSGLVGENSGPLIGEIRTGFTTAMGGGSANQPPVANAGDDQNVALNDTVYLDGSLSFDSEGDEITHAWQWIDTPEDSLAELDDDSSATPSFVADVEGTFILGLTVDDGETQSTMDYVQIFCQ